MDLGTKTIAGVFKLTLLDIFILPKNTPSTSLHRIFV